MVKRAGRSFMETEIVAPLPHIAAVILGCAAGAAQVINQALVNVPGAWHAYIGLGIAVLAREGIMPLVGTQFRQAVRLPQWAAQLLTLLVAAATIVAGQLPAATPIWVQPALAAAVTVLIALGFGPATSPLADQAKRRRHAKRREHAAALLGSAPAAATKKR